MKELIKITLLLIAAFGLIACGGNDHDHDHTHQNDEMVETEEIDANGPNYEVPEEFVSEFEASLDYYFELSSALVEGDYKNSKLHAQELTRAMQEIETGDLEGDAGNFWSTRLESLSENAVQVTGTDNLDQQRYHFEYISDALIEVVQAFGPLSYTVYQQTCPMVRDGSADWLSKDEVILNPYHGDRMLNCGSIVREI